MIERVIIDNYKSFEHFDLKFRDDVNIIVGDNEAGKSSILEAINLALTGQLYGRNVMTEITPYLFNIQTINKYIDGLKSGEKTELPTIRIELYLNNGEDTVNLSGTNNSKRENTAGISLLIEFNEEYTDEYSNYIKSPDEIRTVPVEYYTVKWYSFANKLITPRSIPLNVSLIDTSMLRMQNGTDQYISKIISDALELKERVGMALDYRKLKEDFAERPAIKNINDKLATKKGDLSEKNFTVSIDVTPRSNWESNLSSYLNDIPFQHSGKGEQSAVKMKLALELKAQKAHLILIEEPENHLSFSSMNKLIDQISRKCTGKQLIITTHSTFVLNKMGLDKLILIKNNIAMTLSDLKDETQKYFMKLPGYDTLRMVLAKKAILVEGPSDELIVQKAYHKFYGKLPIEDGVDVIAVNALSFKRFLDIAKKLELDVRVVTDNDGDLIKFNSKYDGYLTTDHIKICYDKNIEYPTLEPQLLRCNDLTVFNHIFNTKHKTDQEMLHYMGKNKTNCAMCLFETDENFNIPGYIHDAIK
ncbi:ATP-dependent nuclease [Paenibacillus pectinilyticus]|uniref:ATP-dependent nuclease n=1 Tax=Paenibacillus pectinilyticus TaxID=512399 RepID=UPI0009FFA786|nr:AAA family ATPase [Paenibacillus pectinilyticus]